MQQSIIPLTFGLKIQRTLMIIHRPEPKDQFYFSRYIDLTSEEDLISALEASRLKTIKCFASINELQGNYAYAEGKWSIKQVLAHCIDTERVFAYRATCFSRKEKLILPGFDQDQYTQEELSSRLPLPQLLEEYDLVRRSTILLFMRMKTENLDFEGIANQVAISARELGWAIAGHDLHHLSVLEERYGVKP